MIGVSIASVIVIIAMAFGWGIHVTKKEDKIDELRKALNIAKYRLEHAQKEIDTVVGRDRLPTFEDRPSLPYLECIMSEVLRWGVPVPLGEPRRSVQFFVTSSDPMQGFPTA